MIVHCRKQYEFYVPNNTHVVIYNEVHEKYIIRKTLENGTLTEEIKFKNLLPIKEFHNQIVYSIKYSGFRQIREFEKMLLTRDDKGIIINLIQDANISIELALL